MLKQSVEKNTHKPKIVKNTKTSNLLDIDKTKNENKSENKLEIKSIKLQNIGPFDEQGLTINFGKKLNPKKANVHIFVGENGCGKSTILGEIFKDLNSELTKYKTYLYYPNEKDYTVNKILRNIGGFVINKYYDSNYLEYIERLENNRNVLLANEYKEKDEKLTEKQIEDINCQLKLTEKLEWFIKQIYGKNFKYKYKSTLVNYKPFLDGKFIEFEKLSLGFYNVICLITDILIKVWAVDSNLEKREELEFVLLLDEIDIHLHPKAQRKILPALQTLFPNVEIFCTTHSPFVVNSVSEAWVYELKMGNGKFIDDQAGEILTEIGDKDSGNVENYKNRRLSSTTDSISYSLSEDFGITAEYGEETQKDLNKF